MPKIVDTLLTLCWHSGDAVMMLCWCSVDALLTLIWWCSSIDTHDIACTRCQYFDYGYMPWHSLWITQDATHKIVDALLTLIFRLGQWPYHDRLYSEWMPIGWLWVHSIAERMDFIWCNTQNRWHSVDNLLTLCGCSVDNPLTLCWRSFWGVAVLTHTVLPIKAANTLIMGKCRIKALRLYKMQHPKLLTLCWPSFPDWG